MNSLFKIWPGLIAFLGMVSIGQAGYIDHNFDVAPFVNGTNFMSQLLQWQASTPGVMVVNTKAASGAQSVLVPDGGAISNAVSVSSPGVVWTDIRIAPFPGGCPGRQCHVRCGGCAVLRVERLSECVERGRVVGLQ